MNHRLTEHSELERPTRIIEWMACTGIKSTNLMLLASCSNQLSYWPQPKSHQKPAKFYRLWNCITLYFTEAINITKKVQIPWNYDSKKPGLTPDCEALHIILDLKWERHSTTHIHLQLPVQKGWCHPSAQNYLFVPLPWTLLSSPTSMLIN